MTTKVSDLDHHAVVDHAVSGLEATVDLNVTGVKVRHALWKIQQGNCSEPNCVNPRQLYRAAFYSMILLSFKCIVN